MKIKILKEEADETWRDESDSETPSQDSDATIKLPRKDAEDEKNIKRTPLGYLRYLGFEDVEPIGSGAVGSVYKADWRGRELAIKIVPKGKIVTDLG